MRYSNIREANVSASLKNIIEFTNQFLNISKVRDYCPNGLQVEGASNVKKIVVGVTASQALIEQAAAREADLLIVHHGYFWKGESQVITGQKKRRISALLQHDMSLAAYHLPLDVHAQVGNNAMLGRVLGLRNSQTHEIDGLPLLSSGELRLPMSLDAWVVQVESILGRKPQLVKCPSGKSSISRVAWCTGGAQSFIDYAEAIGADAYLSGEISEPTFHAVMEGSLHYLAAGHHATERYGIQALGDVIAAEFDVQVEFIDIENPV
jgi:dinuclear metal center YbgI/SA1388 family protein